ncbi:hypothetical protein [Nocardioides sp. GXZ039]|uniref:hypothetical protein n=1 Tax=Nocardioides sp. GXZ039 TaxID=3136018 RepID=UPI0030F42889
MAGVNEGRVVELVERARPNRIYRQSLEWERCATVLDDAVQLMRRAADRHTDIGTQTGPAMNTAFLVAIDTLEHEIRNLRIGSEALRVVAEGAEAAKEKKRKVDQDTPDGPTHGVAREVDLGAVADEQESSYRRGIAQMKSIRSGPDPRRGIPVDRPGAVVVTPPPWWPPKPPPPTQPPVRSVDPDDDDWDLELDFDQPGTPQGPLVATPGTGASPGTLGTPAGAPLAAAPGAPAGALPSGIPTPAAPSPLAPPPVAAPLGVGGALGAPAAANGSGGLVPGSAVRPIGAGGIAGSSGTLSGRGSNRRSGRPATGPAAGAVAGATGRGRGQDRERGRDRDLYDDGEGWLDDESAPDVLR